MAITKDMTIEEIFLHYPEQKQMLAEVLMSVGLGCCGCSGASFETLEQGLQAHGKSQGEIDEVLMALNSVI